jgi:hypothetical protein
MNLMLLASYTVRQYFRAYQRYAQNFWDTMGPMEYICILTFVAVCGFILMRSSR